MAAAGRRRGRRNNGLDATDWRAVEDLDPRVSEDVLAVLATRGIAAYVQPAMDVDPITRSATVPSRPADRLYVDRQHVKAARDLLRGMFGAGPILPAEPPRPGTAPADPLPPTPPARPAGSEPPAAGSPPGEPGVTRPGGPDVDATFAGIVAGFDRPIDPTAAAWPAVENVPSPAGPAEPSAPEPSAPEPADREPPEPERRPAELVDARSVTEPSLLDALDTFGADLPDDEPPEKFVPPPPPPLPRLSRQTVLGALSILGGLVLLLGPPSLLPVQSGTAMLLGFAAILAGAVALILRLRPGTDPEEEPPSDDGAQV